MKKLLVACFLMMCVWPRVVFAEACYSPLEAEADQGLRIHSELMVIGLNCQHIGARHGQNLYQDYQAFTIKHAKLFSTYEKILMRFYKNQGYENLEAPINTLRTTYANKISTDAAKMRPDVFCSRYAPRIAKAQSLSHENLRRWAATIYDTHQVSYPLCNRLKP